MADGTVDLDDDLHLGDRPRQVASVSVHAGDVVPGDRFAGAVADRPVQGQGLGVVGEGGIGRGLPPGRGLLRD